SIRCENNTVENEKRKFEDIFLYIKLRVKLSKSDGTAVTLDKWEEVSMVNNVMHSMFNQVDLSVNDVQTTISLLTYAQKAYFKNLIYSTAEARESYLEGAGWYNDSDDIHQGTTLSPLRAELIEHPKE